MAWKQSPWQNPRQWLTAEVNCESWFRPSLCSWKYRNSYLFYDHHVYIVLMKLKFWKGVCTCSLYWILLYCILCHVKIKIIQALVSQFWYAIILFHEIKKSKEPLTGFLNKPELQYFRTVLCICDGFSDFTPNIYLAKKRKINDPGQFVKLERKSLSEFVKKERNK